MRVKFIEARFFTSCITKLMSDDEYLALQELLIQNPRAGEVIPGSGSLRKIRWRVRGRGKRGGIRVIYYCWSKEVLGMLYAYDKAAQSDLTPGQLKLLRASLGEGVT